MGSHPHKTHAQSRVLRPTPGDRRSRSHFQVSGLRSQVSSSRSAGGFTIVEVMMAAVVLVVGFMGMIQAITLGSDMLATARRQTIAAQILSHEVEYLRLASW